MTEVTKLHELLAKNIKEARNRQKITQEQLAEKSGLTTSFIGEVETCRKYPRPPVMLRIADALGLKPYQLFFEESDHEEIERNKFFSELYLELRDRIDKDLHEVIMRNCRGE